MSSFKKATVMAAGTAALVMAGAGAASAAAEAEGAAVGSPGVVSGLNVQVPIHIPVNFCGNTIDVAGFINPTFGNFCANIDGDHDDDLEAGHHGADVVGGHHG
ncbi:chaplin [Embleya sp. NPDC008237]|uniref:chaplin n=1 Tax=Embleya sp. NPDC008237 TaxID=3363978 RepID=UPI0036F0F8C4